MYREKYWEIRKLGIVIVIISFMMLFWWSFATSWNISDGGNVDTNICIERSIQMVGSHAYIVGENINLIPSQILSGAKISHVLYKGKDSLVKKKWENFTYITQDAGEYQLQTSLLFWWCKYDIITSIEVYIDVVNIIGKSNKKLLDPYKKIFAKKSVLINTISLEDEWWEWFEERLEKNSKKLQKSKNIIIVSDMIDKVLWNLIHSISNTTALKEKNIIIINKMNKNLLQRILSKYKKSFDVNKIFITDQQNFLNIIANLSNEEKLTANEYVNIFSLSSEEKTASYLFLSRVVDILIYNGFPIEIISLLLSISLAVLVVSLFRQVIGFSIFGSYMPLIAGLSVYILGIWSSLILFLFAFVATIMVRIFTRRVYLLYSAKISLLIGIYFILIFIGLAYFHSFLSTIVNLSLFSNILIIFPMVLIILLSEKVFYEWFSFLSKARRISLIEFIVVSYIVYIILNEIIIKNFMLSYPEIIIIIIILIILVGRFTWLQLLEYFRFYSLLKKNDQDEEEEE